MREAIRPIDEIPSVPSADDLAAVCMSWPGSPLAREVFVLKDTMMRVGDRYIASLGLTSARWLLIGALHDAEAPPSVSELSAEALTSVQNVSRMVAAMEEEGLVERFTRPGSGRSVFVRLTDRGREIAERAEERCERLSEAFLRGLSPEDVSRVDQTLRRMIWNMGRFEAELIRERAECESLERARSEDNDRETA